MKSRVLALLVLAASASAQSRVSLETLPIAASFAGVIAAPPPLAAAAGPSFAVLPLAVPAPSAVPVFAAAPPSGAPAQPAPGRPQGLLERLGLLEKILKGGGIEFDGAGRIRPVAEPVDMRAYDNDDNIARFRTRIYLRRKATGEEIALTTAEFAEARTRIGKSGEYADCEFFESDAGGSFRDFRDVLDPDVFPKAAADALDGGRAGTFQGPSWPSFTRTMSHPKRAPWAAVITSRAHEPRNMVRGYDVFKDRGLLARSPREELIFGVGTGSGMLAALREATVPERKIEVIIALLDLLESIPLTEPGVRHAFSYSDDDLDMIARVRDRLAAERVTGRWPHVDPALFSTASGKVSRLELR